MARFPSCIKHPDRISLIHHKTTGDMMSNTTHAHSMTVQARGRSGSLLARLIQVHAGWEQRRHLANLDDAALCDIGLTRAQANVEAARPIWNAPDQWLR
jgi:uncharacterized protein YjiS (DUF1127 family)